MSAESDVELIITTAIATANAKTTEAAHYAQQALDSTNILVDFGTGKVNFVPNVKLDLVDSSGLVVPVGLDDISNFPSMIDDITNRLTNQFTDFFARYFPNDCGPHVKAVQKLCDILDNGGSGIPAYVEDQIWQRDRARVLVDAARVEDEAISTWTARGYPLPPGAVVHAVLMLQQQLQDKIAQASRDVAIKQFEMAVELMKFAIQQAIDWRIKSIDAAAAYIRTLALAPELAAKVVLTQLEARAKAADIISTYYRTRVDAASSLNNARIQLEQLRYDPLKTTAQLTASLNTEFGHTQVGIANARANAAMGAANAAGNQGAAALSQLSAIASLSSVS